MKIDSKLVLNIFGYGLHIEPTKKKKFSHYISKERNMFVAESLFRILKNMESIQFLQMEKVMVSKSCQFLKLRHHVHSFEKSLIERTIQYIKDRTESFDDYSPVKERSVS